MTAGRPTTYNEVTAALICGRMANGESLRSICRDPKMPALSSVFLWLSKYPEFSEQYELAMASRADAVFEEMFDIADDGQNDWMEILDNEGGCVGWKLNGENVQRSRLRIDMRKWALSKMMPKKYGNNQTTGDEKDKIELEIKRLELEKLKKEINPPKIDSPDEDYKITLKPDEDIPDEPIL